MRSKPFHFIAALTTFLFSCVLPGPKAATLPEVWFAPLQGYENSHFGRVGVSDLQDLFKPGSDWERAASDVKVFKMLENYLRTSSDEDMRQALAFLKQHHMALAIEIGLLPYDAACPPLEGYDSDQLKIALRIQRLGGEIAYVAADSPFLQGLEGSRTPGCNQSLDVLAQKAAAVARLFRSVFPNVKFVDIEAVMNFKEPNAAQLISQWHSAFANEFGEPFTALHFDNNWNVYWQGRVRSVYDQMRRDHMAVGVICDGSLLDHDDAAWLTSAKNHCASFVQSVGQPDSFVIQSWFPFPTRALPESDPSSFTHMILDVVGAQHN